MFIHNILELALFYSKYRFKCFNVSFKMITYEDNVALQNINQNTFLRSVMNQR